MAAERKRMTPADYAALAICPALIVMMLAALVHFLILCGYRGDFSTRLTYILFMFIVGATGIARITIESGRAYASAYALALGLATVFVLAQFSNPLFAIGMVALVWFLADHITFDCTVIDDNERASSEGLLGVGSLLGGRRPAPKVDVQLDGTSASPADSDSDSDSRSKQRRRRGPKKPGRSVFWLALAALPLFGIGQLMLPDVPEVRSRALLALGVYLFATLMLLVTTSFLGLRAYLRRRGADMPANVSVAWLAGGMVLTLLLLMLCFALPMPGRAIAQWELPPSLESPEGLTPSRFGWGNEGVENNGSPDVAQGPVDESKPKVRSGTDEDAEKSGGSSPPQGQNSKPSSDGDASSESKANAKGQDSSASGDENASPQDGGEAKSQNGGESQSKDGGESQSQDDGEAKSQNGGESQSQDGGESESQDGGESQSQDGGESQSQDGGESQSQDGESASSAPPENSGEDDPAAENQQGSSDGASDSESAGGEPPSNNPEASPPFNPFDWLPKISSLLKLLLVAILVAIIVWFLIVNRGVLAAMWAAFTDFWKRLQREAGVAADEPDEEAALAERVYRRFDSFQDPTANASDPNRSVVLTFLALEAWSREHQLPRGDDETPTEFAARLARQHRPRHTELNRLAVAYNRIVYGRRSATKADLQAARILWQWMVRGQVAPPEVHPAGTSR